MGQPDQCCPRPTGRTAANTGHGPLRPPCPACGVLARRVHAYHTRRLADVPVGSGGVVVDLRIRRLV
ncbi:transposase family protein [Nonomuraea basaltis]|uniref:transposase family protein n=1 Tax=Nonomuraea basaltis TaxID=2495887 RepID=UPI003B84A13C